MRVAMNLEYSIYAHQPHGLQRWLECVVDFPKVLIMTIRYSTPQAGGIGLIGSAIRRPNHRQQPSASVGNVNVQGSASRALLITGGTGTLGQAFARICQRRGLPYYLLKRDDMDITNVDSISSAVDRYEPWAIVNAAGFVRVDDAEKEVERCMRDNVTGPTNLAGVCAEKKIPLVTFSSDLVFDGLKQTPYVESDSPRPMNIYGKSKRDAEKNVLEALPAALAIRTSAFFGPWDQFNFVSCVLSTISQGQTFWAADDQTVSPTYVPDLVNATLDLLIDGEEGVWHLANAGALTWAQFARRVAQIAGYDQHWIRSCDQASLRLDAVRPRFSALSSERATLMRPLEAALHGFSWNANMWITKRWQLRDRNEDAIWA